MAPDERAIVIAGELHSGFWKVVTDENIALEDTFVQVHATGSLGDLPLVVEAVRQQKEAGASGM